MPDITLTLSTEASDTGDATYSISGDTYAGSTLTAAVSTDDPDGNGTVTYTWQSSSDDSTWSEISGAIVLPIRSHLQKKENP